VQNGHEFKFKSTVARFMVLVEYRVHHLSTLKSYCYAATMILVGWCDLQLHQKLNRKAVNGNVYGEVAFS